MATIYISEAEAARDLHGLLTRVRAGAEIVIDDASPAVRLSVETPKAGRLLSESIARLEARERKQGEQAPFMDADFAADMEEIIRQRKPRDTSAWD